MTPATTPAPDPDAAMCLLLLGIVGAVIAWDIAVIWLGWWDYTVSSLTMTAAHRSSVAAAMLGLMLGFVVGHLVSGDVPPYKPAYSPLAVALIALNVGVPLGWWLWRQ